MGWVYAWIPGHAMFSHTYIQGNDSWILPATWCAVDEVHDMVALLSTAVWDERAAKANITLDPILKRGAVT